MGGSSKGVTESIEEGINDTVEQWREDPLNEFVRFSTEGHYDPKTGKWGGGWGVQHLDEGIGEISGRNKARDQQYTQEKIILQENEKMRAQNLREQNQAYQEDLAASRSGEALRQTISMRNSGSRMSASPKLGGDEQDYLGL